MYAIWLRVDRVQPELELGAQVEKKSHLQCLHSSELSFVKHEPKKTKARRADTNDVRVKLTEEDLKGLYDTLKKHQINPMLACVLQDAKFQPVEISVAPCEMNFAALPLKLPARVP